MVGDDGKIYCEDHAPQNEHVTQCCVCRQVFLLSLSRFKFPHGSHLSSQEIVGECFMVGDDYFHEECLTCVRCRVSLQGKDFYGGQDGLVCGRCKY